jgi:pimeloyl-ACP methyl ester carboxylesterase
VAVHEVELSAGWIRYREAGEGKPIVFVHGLLVDGTLWRNVTPPLERGFRCIVPDWPLGSHRTWVPDSAELSPRGVATLVSELLDRLGLEDVTLVANDTGGAIAQIFAAERPDRLARLVLTPCDAFDNFFPPLFRALQLAARVPGGLDALIQPLRLRQLRRLPMAFGLLTKRPVPEEVSDRWLEPYFTSASVRRDTRRFVRAVDAHDTLAAAERLAGFAAPVLLAWASEDRVFPLEHARRLASILPNATVAEIPDSYSFVPEDQPERLAELIGEFLTSSASAY